MVRNKLHWDANDAVGPPKQKNSYQSSPTFLCFGSPTASFASQCNLFRTMWLDPAKGLFLIATLLLRNAPEVSWGEQGWRSGASTCLPPLWPGFDSRARRHMLSLLLVSSLMWRFLSGFSGFPPSTKINTSKFLFHLETVDEEPLRAIATANYYHHYHYHYAEDFVHFLLYYFNTELSRAIATKQ